MQRGLVPVVPDLSDLAKHLSSARFCHDTALHIMVNWMVIGRRVLGEDVVGIVARIIVAEQTLKRVDFAGARQGL